MGTLVTIFLVFISGLINYFIIANLIDKLSCLIYSKIFKLPGLLHLENTTPSSFFEQNYNQLPKINFFLNVIRPFNLTILIFGLGICFLLWLEISALAFFISSLWYFILTTKACLSGRIKTYTDPAYWITYILTATIFICTYWIKYKN